MIRVGHVIYKADDLDQAVAGFRAEGFDVEYGRARNPRNAVIYFSVGPYLEIISRVSMPGFVRGYLKLIGQGRMVAVSDSVASRRQGYSRIVLEAQREQFADLKRIYQRHGLKTLVSPISRRDLHGRRLSCTCLVPDDWGVPMFVTPFGVDIHRDSAHPNGITQIAEVFFAGSQAAAGVCQQAGVEDRLKVGSGDGTISVRFA